MPYQSKCNILAIESCPIRFTSPLTSPDPFVSAYVNIPNMCVCVCVFAISEYRFECAVSRV